MDRASKAPGLRDQRNVIPLPYRRVSMQWYDGPMSEAAIVVHLLGREAYRRTDYIVLRARNGRSHRPEDIAYAVVAVTRTTDDPLFSPITAVELLALPDSCAFVKDPATDCGNPSAMAELAHRHGVGADRTLIVEGLYDHVNFIHHPDPLVIRIVEVVPPEPPKLYDLAKRVLAYADLPPIRIELQRIEITGLARQCTAREYLVPCRSGGLDELGAPVSFLDERPEERRDWVLVGCERSLQFHRHYYGDEPTRVEMCPRQIAEKSDQLTLLKCCLLEFDIERDGRIMTVPWGSDLAMVERALRELAGVGDHA